MTVGYYASGLSNRLTWLFFIFIQNDHCLLLKCRELARNADNKYQLADEIQSLVEGLILDWVKEDASDGKGRWSGTIGVLVYDLIAHCAYNVNWSELAERYLEQVS